APAAGAARKAARKMACAGNCFMLAPSRRRLGRQRILGLAAGATPDGPVGPANRPDWPPSRARPTERTHTRGGEAAETDAGSLVTFTLLGAWHDAGSTFQDAAGAATSMARAVAPARRSGS